jgi:ubiquitin-protein ligase E3 A
LEKSTRYEGGFIETSATIEYFWKVVHAMNDDEKRLLLQFITGCDRAPVGGLKKLELIIARNGGDDNTRYINVTLHLQIQN